MLKVVYVMPIKWTLCWTVLSFLSIVGVAGKIVFHQTPDLHLVDGGQALGSQQMSNLAQISHIGSHKT